MNLFVPATVKRCFVGIWLTFLYLFCVHLAVFSLCTSLFQLKLNSTLKKSTGDTSPFIEHYCDTSAIKDDPDQGLLKIVPCIPTSVVEKERYFTSAEVLVFYNKMKSLEIEFGNEAYLMLERATNNLNKIQQKIDNAKDEKTREKFEEDLKFMFANLERSELAIKRLEEMTGDQLSGVYIEIEHFEKFFKHISWILGENEYLWAFPQPMLKIVLVLSMGILGSLIFVSIEFIKEPRGELLHRFNMYFFRPFLGMIVALAMYVMVKSGLSTIVDGTAGDLSPFLISFLGIVSGMLSEQAYKRIATTGNEMLASNTNKKEEIDRDQAGN